MAAFKASDPERLSSDIVSAQLLSLCPDKSSELVHGTVVNVTNAAFQAIELEKRQSLPYVR